MKLLAHITEADGIRQEQMLKEHCYKTAIYAAESIGKTKLYNTVYLAGLLHDCGKAKKEFVDYLEAAFRGEKVIRGSICHTFTGCILLMEKFHTADSTLWEKLTCEIIAYAVGAHHGMFDCVDLDGRNGFVHRLQKDRGEIGYEEAIQNYFAEVASEDVLTECFQKAVPEIRDFFVSAKETYPNKGEDVCYQISMLTRLVLSAVIYGDRRDTGEFMDGRHRGGEEKLSWEQRQTYFENKIRQLPVNSDLNQVRSDISEKCLEFAQRPPGIYRLSLPTGAGKTLCALRYALAHAKAHEKKRIIFIIPLLSVLDQNAKVIREYVPDATEVLEHHSNVVREQYVGEELDQYELLTENWQAPIIVSTLVQFLNILFDGRNSAVGRMQALCDSVIVIDEVQSVPKKVTAMFNLALNFLQQYCDATIVLSSATQPCFEETKWPLRISGEADMVQLDPAQKLVFKRARIIDGTDPYGMDLDACAAFCYERMEQHASLLVVCNTKAEARGLYEKLRDRAAWQEWDMYHLSTAMCQEHRKYVMAELREKLSILQQGLRVGRPVRKLLCISTQLIEAGIDISCEGVVRILAGIDNLAQAAGRCNRSNEYAGRGSVYLIKLKNENLSMLPDIANAQKSTLKVLEQFKGTEESVIEERATRSFYRYLFQETKNNLKFPVQEGGMSFYLKDFLSNINPYAQKAGNENYFLHQPFQTVGRKFCVFENVTTDVLVPYGKGKMLLKRLQDLQKIFYPSKELEQIMQQVKPYTVSIFEWQKKKLDEAGLLIPALDGRALVLKEEAYSDCYGLVDAGEQPVENYMI